jgi:hypothetical protein
MLAEGDGKKPYTHGEIVPQEKIIYKEIIGKVHFPVKIPVMTDI